jgi:hypothetical protein
MRRIRTLAMLTVAAFAFAQSQSEKTLWHALRQGLTKDNAAEYWESSVKGALLPGGGAAIPRFHGIVASSDAPDHPSLIVIAIQGETEAEITIRIRSGGLQFALPKGSLVRFQGVATSFNKDPFMLTLEATPDDVIRDK